MSNSFASRRAPSREKNGNPAGYSTGTRPSSAWCYPSTGRFFGHCCCGIRVANFGTESAVPLRYSLAAISSVLGLAVTFTRIGSAEAPVIKANIAFGRVLPGA